MRKCFFEPELSFFRHAALRYARAVGRGLFNSPMSEVALCIFGIFASHRYNLPVITRLMEKPRTTNDNEQLAFQPLELHFPRCQAPSRTER